ncbi:unnamed protein product [Peniophora sp. CBMAI 1063]|nr:unnamed protein product [Peniophora sp. CBMAI 1063]
MGNILNKFFHTSGDRTVGEPIISPLRLWHIPQAAQSGYRAFEPMAFKVYLRTEHDQGAWWRRLAMAILQRFEYYLKLVVTLADVQKEALQIDGGIAGCTFQHGADHTPPKPGLVEDVVWICFSLLRNFVRTSEQRLRWAELLAKNAKARQEAFEAYNEHEPWHRDLLLDIWTDPLVQGRGYGTALLQTLIDKADQSGRGMWLSAPEVNVPFYAAAGFFVAARFELGDHNPKWSHEPIGAVIMMRGARIQVTARAT